MCVMDRLWRLGPAGMLLAWALWFANTFWLHLSPVVYLAPVAMVLVGVVAAIVSLRRRPADPETEQDWIDNAANTW